MDELDRLAEPGRELLRRVDDLLEWGGAPESHRIWPLLRRLRLLPGSAFEVFAALRPAPLTEAGHGVRRLVRRYDHACAKLTDDGAWVGTAAAAYGTTRQALVAHLDDGPESLVGRLESTAGYADALADWVDRSRLTLARTVADAIGSVEAVTVAGAARTADGVTDREAVAAAEIGARVLATLSVAYDGAERLLHEWSPSLAESTWSPPTVGPAADPGWQATLRIGH